MTERDISELSREEKVIREIFEEEENGWEIGEQLIELGLDAREIVGRMQKENYTAASNNPSHLSICKKRAMGTRCIPALKPFN